MSLTSETQCSSMRTMPIIDDDVVRICPSDLIEWDNRGTKGVILGQKSPEEPVSDYYRHFTKYFSEKERSQLNTT